MIPYIFHAAVLIVLFYLLYKFLLSKETFFGLNRYLLMVSIALAFALPLYEVPQAWSIWEAPVQVVSTSNTTSELAELETTFQPIEETKNIVLSNQEGTSKKQLATDNPEIIEWNAISIWQVLWTIYLIGVGIFSINLLIQLATLIYKIVRLPSLKDGQFRIVELDKDEPPYSFLNCIFINPEKYDWETYNQIIEHEKIHVQQRHSLDMLLAESLVVLQWFNPAAWQYRKMIEHNLEFLTDQAMLVQGAKRETYQLNLLKVSVPQYPIGLAMNYNQSILKKRIKMMNAKKSSVQSSWKYLTILPVFALSIILLNGVKAQQVALETEVANLQAIDASTDISNNEITENQSIPVAINQQEEIQEAVVSPEVNTESQTLNISEEVRSEMEKYPILEGDLKGFWQAQINGNEVCVRFDNSNFNKGNMWMTTECFGANEFTNPPSNGRGTFTLSRAAGTIELVGEMEDDYGQGRYTFTSSDEFESYLAKKGIRDLDEKYLFHLFTANISP
ncbi:MAG: M56 family metallopeptidase, partial [Bacteroidota bacterium]